MHTNALWYVITVFEQQYNNTANNLLKVIKVVIKPTKLFNAKQRKRTRHLRKSSWLDFLVQHSKNKRIIDIEVANHVISKYEALLKKKIVAFKILCMIWLKIRLTFYHKHLHACAHSSSLKLNAKKCATLLSPYFQSTEQVLFLSHISFVLISIFFFV